MKYIIYVLLFSVMFIAACSKKYGITQSHAYVREHISGNLPVNDNGQPMNNQRTRLHYIYIKTAKDKPLTQWDYAWLDGNTYKLRAIEIKDPGFSPGKLKATQEEVHLDKKENEQLWQLELIPVTDVQQEEKVSTLMKTNAVVLQGRMDTKPVYYGIKKIEELAILMMP